MRRVAAPLAVIFVLAGCLSRTHRIPSGELARLSTIAPEVRGQSVTVRQQLVGDEPPPAQRVHSDTQIVVFGGVHVSGSSGGGGSSGGRPPPATTGGPKGPIKGPASNAKETAIAVLVIAALGVVILAVTEGQRFSGTVQLHPMHPVHMYLHDGSYVVAPLAHIDPQLAAATRRAVVRDTEGPWSPLSRDPLDRVGATYSVLLGANSSVSADGTLGVGPGSHIQIGVFPTQTIGVLADIAFGWRQNRVDATLFDTRYAVELQAWPVVLGPMHGGVFGNVGLAARWEDGIARGNATSLAASAGAQLQLDLTTFLALSARFGVIRAHDDFTREVMVGLSVY